MSVSASLREIQSVYSKKDGVRGTPYRGCSIGGPFCLPSPTFSPSNLLALWPPCLRGEDRLCSVIDGPVRLPLWQFQAGVAPGFHAVCESPPVNPCAARACRRSRRDAKESCGGTGFADLQTDVLVCMIARQCEMKNETATIGF